jgi:hypothetical protein
MNQGRTALRAILMSAGVVLVSWIIFSLYPSRLEANRLFEKFSDEAKAQDARTPILVNENMALYATSVSLVKNQGVIYEYMFTTMSKSELASTDMAQFSEGVLDSYCQNAFRHEFQKIGGVKFLYLSKDREEVLSLQPTPRDCASGHQP